MAFPFSRNNFDTMRRDRAPGSMSSTNQISSNVGTAKFSDIKGGGGRFEELGYRGKEMNSLLVPLQSSSRQDSNLLEKNSRGPGLPQSCMQTSGIRDEDSQRTTMGHPLDSQMTYDEHQMSNSQSWSQNGSQPLIDDAIVSQHRFPTSSQNSQSYSGNYRCETPSVSRAQTPIPRSVHREDGSRSNPRYGTSQEQKPPKAPTWNPNLVKRAASPVFDALRTMDSTANSPTSIISSQSSSIDTVVGLLRSNNVEPLVRDLAKEIQNRFEILRTQIKEGQDGTKILGLLRDQETAIIQAIHKTEDVLRNIQECQGGIERQLNRIETKIDNNAAEFREHLQPSIEKQNNCRMQRTYAEDDRESVTFAPVKGRYMDDAEEESFDIFQEFGVKARLQADQRINKIQKKVEAKRRRIQAP